MNKRDLKKMIVDSYKAETPALASKIIVSCKAEQQESATASATQSEYSAEPPLHFSIMLKRVAAVAACLILLVTVIITGLLPKDDNGAIVPVTEAETFIYIDVNPSIELQMDSENKVLKCLAGNEDAFIIISDLKLEGVDMNTAIALIMESMQATGYLTEDSNSILVSIQAKDNDTTKFLLSGITNSINTICEKSGLECSIIAQGVQVDEALKKRAQEKGVSVGKMHLVDKIVDGIEDFNAEDALELVEMSIKELNLVYATKPDKDNSEGDSLLDDIVSSAISGFVQQNDALSLLLSEIDIDLSEIEWYHVQAKPQNNNGNRKMVYSVSIRLRDDPVTYSFQMDCKTGEILKIDESMPKINIPNLTPPSKEEDKDTPPHQDIPTHQDTPPSDQNPDFQPPQHPESDKKDPQNSYENDEDDDGEDKENENFKHDKDASERGEHGDREDHERDDER